MRPKNSPELKRARDAWRAAKRRCTEPGFRSFGRYGGAGIRMCPQWILGFEQFLADMGLPPSPVHWLGRRDVKGHYTPDNCIWTEQAPQKGRRAYCRKVIVDGQVMTASEAGRMPGQPTRNSVLRRWDAGLSLEHPQMSKIYRRSLWITHQGETLPLPEWARRIGLPSQVLWSRVNRGMPIERAMTPGRFREAKKRSSQKSTTN